jgi:hypothetical protein
LADEAARQRVPVDFADPVVNSKESQMKRTTWLCLLVGVFVGVALLSAGGVAMADAPKVSTFAPAKDLAGQVNEYLKDLEDAVKNESEFADNQGKIAKDANTLIVIVLALGMHDTDNPYKAAAPALIKATQDLAAAKDHAAAKAATEAVKKAASSKAGGADKLKWEKVASLPELMKAVPLINNKLKRSVGGSRFEKKLDESAGYSAALAAIAQGAIANSGETEKPGEVEKWGKFCVQMREAAAAVNAGIHAKDQKATEAAMEKLTQSCDDCHAVFHADVKK